MHSGRLLPRLLSPAAATCGSTEPHQLHARGAARLGHMVPSSSSVRHFSQANPKGPGQDDVPALLRRVADSIERLGHIEVEDIVLNDEITADGRWYSMTVYFHDAEE